MEEQLIKENNLNKLFEYLRGNKEVSSLTEFSLLAGKNKSFMSEILSGKRTPTTRILRQIVERLCNKFPYINKDWVITGEGNMIKGVASTSTTSPSYEALIKEKDRIISEQAQHISTLKQSLNINAKVIDVMSETLKRAMVGEGLPKHKLNKKAASAG